MGFLIPGLWSVSCCHRNHSDVVVVAVVYILVLGRGSGVGGGSGEVVGRVEFVNSDAYDEGDR